MNITKLLQFDDSQPVNLTLSSERESHEPMETEPPNEKMYHETINWRTNYLSCAVTVRLKIYLLPLKMISLAGIAARNS